MKRVILLGDSIRLGYEPLVREQLAGEAFVWGPAENGQHTVHLLMNFWQWVVSQQPDVLHLNAGHWDTRHIIRGVADNIVPLPQYRENVARAIRAAQQHTRARIIWATTTPFFQAPLDRGHARGGLAGRDATDIPRYNAAAVAVARDLGVVVNDLYTTVQAADPATLLSEDGVHFHAAGNEFLGRAVAAAIRPHLVG